MCTEYNEVPIRDHSPVIYESSPAPVCWRTEELIRTSVYSSTILKEVMCPVNISSTYLKCFLGEERDI